jgi:hypothetical protein
VKIASADPAQVYFDHDLVGSQCRKWAFLEREFTFSGEYHCRHRHNEDLPLDDTPD